jgi:hypothetical protein
MSGSGGNGWRLPPPTDQLRGRENVSQWFLLITVLLGGMAAFFVLARNMDGGGPFNTDNEWDLTNPLSRHYKARNIVMQNVNDPGLLQRLHRNFNTRPLHEMCSAIASSLMPSARSELASQVTEHAWQQGDDISSYFNRAANLFAAL